MWSFFACRYQILLFCVTVPFTLHALCLNMHVNDFTPQQGLCKTSVLTFPVSQNRKNSMCKINLCILLLLYTNLCFHHFCCKRKVFSNSEIFISRDLEIRLFSSQSNLPICAVKNDLHIFVRSSAVFHIQMKRFPSAEFTRRN